MKENEFLWVEKYRPQTLEDCILPADVKAKFRAFVEQGNVPTLLLTGAAGTGKTTVAKAVLNDLNCDYMVINGSLEGRLIETLRNNIQAYASTVSLMGGRKYIILDEADYLNAESLQPALRAFMEQFADNAGFILTCNWVNRIIPPLISRCSQVDFRIQKEDRQAVMGEYLIRVAKILKQEKVTFDPSVLAAFVKQLFPDLRKTLNELQKYSATGKIDTGILAQRNVDNFKDLIDTLKKKEFSKVKQWVEDNKDIDFATFCLKFYEAVQTSFPPQEWPRIILILADYSYKNAFVANQEINTLACLTEVMLGE